MIPCRFVKYRESLIAASVVSVPELAKNVRTFQTFPTFPWIGAIEAGSSASLN